MIRPSAALAQGFSNVGHSFSHILTILYPTVVIGLEREWGMSYGELIALMLAGQLLFGAAALPAGWLGDRWSTLGMMVVFFVGSGTAAVATGLATGPLGLAFGLAAIGLFAAIYHPVGMAWLVRTAKHRGRALGFNGMFGAVGLALGPLIAGILTDTVSWRAAFIVPGSICLILGLALWGSWRLGYVEETRADVAPQLAPASGDVVRAFFILSLTMMCVGLIGQSFQVMLPKLFAERAGIGAGTSALGAGVLVTVVYMVASTAQIVGGRLSDRFSMKRVYMTAFMIQAPMLAIAATLDGAAVVAVAIAMVYTNIASLPAENGMLAHYTPGKWRGTAYGAKFVLSLGASAMGVPLIAFVHDATGTFTWLFLLLSALAAVVFVSAIFLPDDRRARAPVPAPAAAE